jgi:integrase
VAGKFRVSYYEGDDRKYKRFDTKREAKQFAAEVRGGYGELIVSIEDRALLTVMRRAATGAGVEMGDAVRRFLMDLERSTADVDAGAALQWFTADCQARGLRARTVTNYSFFVGALLDAIGKMSVSEIRREMVMRWVIGAYQGQKSRDTARAYVMGWLRWCERKGWTRERWTDALDVGSVMRDEKRVPILDPGAFERVIRNAQANIRPALALMAFAGIRPEEVVSVDKAGLDWKHIDMNARRVEIPGAVAKTRAYRVLDGLPGNVWSWLGEWKKREGPVCPVQHQAFSRARARAAQSAGVEWKPDVLRHSFASYAFHQIGVERTIEVLGHTSPNMFFRHYKGSGSAEAAKAWFGIEP